MDSLITAAARALTAGDPLGALQRVALRDDAPALALRGIAMAQLGDLVRAKALLRRAARTFGVHEAVARARCLVAEAEVALAARDLRWQPQSLDRACATLSAHGDHLNAAHAELLALRRLLLIGQIDMAEHRLSTFDSTNLPPALRAIHQLVLAGVALRRLRVKELRAALTESHRAACEAGISALLAEVESTSQRLAAPAARAIQRGGERLLLLDEVEAMLATDALVVDACRHVVCQQGNTISLARRPVLFLLVRALAEGWPGDVSRNTLIARAFRSRYGDESHRVRLRVEIGRLRKVLQPLVQINATSQGFVMVARRCGGIVVLARPVEEKHAALLACLADGESWSSSALALALGESQRNVQRALDVLAAARKVQPIGHGRARRWVMPPLPGFTTSLLLTVPLPGE